MKKVKTTLNKKEYELFMAIKNFIEINNYSPSYRELLQFDIYKSISSICETIVKFAELGYIKVEIDENGRIKSRTIRLIYTSEIREKIEKIGEILDEDIRNQRL